MMYIGSERWEATRDLHGWTLTETYEGRAKDGQMKQRTRATYHRTLEQCIRHVLDCEAGEQDSLEAQLDRLGVMYSKLIPVLAREDES